MMKQFELKPYQQALFDKISAGGFQAGELVVFSAGRQTGKSIYSSNLCQEVMYSGFVTVDQALVDNEPWYVIRTHSSDVAAWLRSQPKELRHEYSGNQYRYGNMFDVKENLYLLLSLKWQS